LVVDSKEIGLEVNADKTKDVVQSRDQNSGRSHSSFRDVYPPVSRPWTAWIVV